MKRILQIIARHLNKLWVRSTTKEHWCVSERGTMDWLYFSDRDKALKSAFINKTDLERFWWSDCYGWVNQTDMDEMEIQEKLRN